MNNEDTILDPQYINSETQNNETTQVEQPKAEVKNGASWGEKAAYAAGGAVVGAGVTLAGQAVASPSANNEDVPQPTEEEEASAVAASAAEGAENTAEAAAENANEAAEQASAVAAEAHEAARQTASATASTEEQHAAPEPEEAIVATATGVRVAQVDDEASFSQAFADARAQVGPGGVFEWHGRAYSTYYKEEWDSMTAEQKHEYQASIDYKDVLSDDSMAQHHNDMAQHHHTPHHDTHTHHAAHHEQEVTAKPDTSYETQEATADDIDVQVLEVGQTDLDGNGIPENAAVLEVNGHEVLIVDVDQDGVADAAIADFDGDGELEIADVESEGLPMPDQSAGDAYMAQADAAPDYMNDANVGMYEI